VRAQTHLYGSRDALSEEEALHAFWKGRGVQLEGQRNALVKCGTGLASAVAERSLYRNTDGACGGVTEMRRRWPPACTR
jgi:hypothetical protein